MIHPEPNPALFNDKSSKKSYIILHFTSPGMRNTMRSTANDLYARTIMTRKTSLRIFHTANASAMAEPSTLSL